MIVICTYRALFILTEGIFRDGLIDLRYPPFSERYQSYSFLSVGRQDTDITLKRFQTMKRFLRNMHQLRK